MIEKNPDIIRKFLSATEKGYDYAIKNDMNVKKYSEYIDIGKKTTKLVRIPFEEVEIDKLWENVDRMDFIESVLACPIILLIHNLLAGVLSIRVANV